MCVHNYFFALLILSYLLFIAVITLFFSINKEIFALENSNSVKLEQKSNVLRERYVSSLVYYEIKSKKLP